MQKSKEGFNLKCRRPKKKKKKKKTAARTLCRNVGGGKKVGAQQTRKAGRDPLEHPIKLWGRLEPKGERGARISKIPTNSGTANESGKTKNSAGPKKKSSKGLYRGSARRDANRKKKGQTERKMTNHGGGE